MVVMVQSLENPLLIKEEQKSPFQCFEILQSTLYRMCLGERLVTVISHRILLMDFLEKYLILGLGRNAEHKPEAFCIVKK
jgi:hypothetical protein